MKSEMMIAFSPLGVIALIVAVVVLCVAATGAWLFLFIAFPLLAFVLEDTREDFRAGLWKRGWFIWTWKGPSQ